MIAEEFHCDIGSYAGVQHSEIQHAFQSSHTAGVVSEEVNT